MDLSYWAKYNPKVVFAETKKQFFGKYVIKAEYAVISALYINRAKPGQMKEYIAWREIQARTRTGMVGGFNPYWTRDHNVNTDCDMLNHFGDLKRSNKDLKFRLESHKFDVYVNEEAELKKFHDSILPAYQYTIAEITNPKDMHCKQLLEAGHILGKNLKSYKYKITLRDGKYDPEAKVQLLNYLDSLGEDVTINKATRRALENGHRYTWGNYIHTNDPSILTFVNLIIPGIVNKTHELTKI